MTIEEKIKNLDAEYEIIKIKIKKNRQRNLIMYLKFFVAVIILYFLRFPLDFLFPFSLGIGLIIPGVVANSINVNDRVIINLYESIELLKLSRTDSTLRISAYKKFKDAMEEVKFYRHSYVPWNSNNNEINEKFIINMNNRISPAIRKGEVNHEEIQEIALLFIDSDISDIEKINKKVEASFKDETIKDKTEGRFSGTMRSIFSNLIVKAISSILGGFLSSFLLSQLYFYIIGDIIDNQTIFGAGAALSFIFAPAVSLTHSKYPKLRIKNGRPEIWVEDP